MSRWQIGGLTAALMLSFAGLAHGEMYVAGQIGYAVPGDLVTKFGSLDLQNSLSYGAKVGYFFPHRNNWFGVETEVYNATPNIKQGNIPPNPSNPGAFSGPVGGSHMSVTNWAFNAIMRIPNNTVQPYAGLGIGINFANVSEGPTFGNGTSVTPSFNILAGVRTIITERVALFGEYKYNFTELSFSQAELNGAYRTSIFMAGISFHFRE